MRKEEPTISPRAINMLVKLRQEAYKDGENFEVLGYGKFALARMIDDFIGNVLELETAYHIATRDLEIERKENEGYSELLGGYTADILNDEEKAKLRAMVAEWKKADVEEEE